uniref:Uncharacterized protein n=1 Tax=Geospiza parvula TaxID=87175 RepID=A0A8C3M870_GEOPR
MECKWRATSQIADVITQTEVIHTLPGTDITLVCVFPKLHSTHIIQTQWSKADGSPSTKMAVYHLTYGTHYFKMCCSGDNTGSLCSTNPNATSECNWWVLHLENITVSLTGQYECTFATYPYGTKRHYLKKVWLKQTLEIPCLEDETSENLSTYPLKWLMVSIFHLRYKNSSMLYGQKVLLGLNNTLKVFPTKITDDGRVFSCHMLYHPEGVQKSSTTVRVFGKGLMPTACCLALEKVTLLPGSEASLCRDSVRYREAHWSSRSLCPNDHAVSVWDYSCSKITSSNACDIQPLPK